jgi:hypothetical protein
MTDLKRQGWHRHPDSNSTEELRAKAGDIIGEFMLVRKKDLKTMDFHSHNDTEWKTQHFYSQKKGDYARPKRCLNCMGEEFIETTEGWRCKDCLALIWGSDFFQGRNSMKEEMEKKAKT